MTSAVFERSSNTTSAPAARSSPTPWLPVATAIARALPAAAQAMSSGVSPMTTTRSGRSTRGPPHASTRATALASSALRSRRVVTKCAAGKVSPEVEVLQLHARGRLIVAGQQRQIHVVARQQRVEQRADAGHHAFARTGFLELAGEVTKVYVGEASEIGSIAGDAVFDCGVREDQGIGATGHRDAAECIGNREELLEGESHRAGACAAGEHKRAVDVEENESGRDAQGFRLRRERFRRADLSPTVPLRS